MLNNSSKSLRDIDARTRWKWRLPHVKLVNNHEFCCNLVKGKSVLHIGCTDHKELIDIKMENHGYLHVKLMKYAKKFMSLKSLLVIGTPNSFKLHSFFTVLRGYEEINPDHKYYFSYSTLRNLLENTGFVVDKWYVYIR